MKPLVSICIPAFKQASTFKNLLSSINEQTFTDFEVVVSDDSPGTEVEEIVNQDNWNFDIQYFKNSPSKGSPGNWNNAISKAQGTWIKLMHHDDWFEFPHSLKHFVEAATAHPNRKFFFSGSWIFDTRNGDKFIYTPVKHRIDNIEERPAELFHANVIGAPTATFIHREVIELYDENLIWLVDIEYYSRLIVKYGVVKIEEALVSTSAGQPEQLTSSLLNNKEVELKEFFYCYEKLFPIFNGMNISILRQRILFLLQNYQVESIAEIRDSGFKGKIPKFVQLYFLIGRINKTLAIKTLGKWIQSQLN
ncbi:MAG: glycosyltransferase family 2 protein [Bacteroidia bacterium]